MGLSRRLVLLAALGFMAAPRARADETRTVRVTVKNLVCPKCAGKIAKGLLAEPGIERVDSSVPEQRFTLGVKGAGPSDARLRELVEHEGVSVVSIRRD